MAFFPVSINLSGKKILIVGGGHIAFRKLKTLMDFTNNVNIISPSITEETKKMVTSHSLNYIKREYQTQDLTDHDIVVVAANDLTLQQEISEECQKRNILCNCVDSAELSSFIFPSIVKKGDLTVATSTSGTSPKFAKQFKEFLRELLPDNVEEYLKKEGEKRKEKFKL